MSHVSIYTEGLDWLLNLFDACYKLLQIITTLAILHNLQNTAHSKLCSSLCLHIIIAWTLPFSNCSMFRASHLKWLLSKVLVAPNLLPSPLNPHHIIDLDDYPPWALPWQSLGDIASHPSERLWNLLGSCSVLLFCCWPASRVGRYFSTIFMSFNCKCRMSVYFVLTAKDCNTQWDSKLWPWSFCSPFGTQSSRAPGHRWRLSVGDCIGIVILRYMFPWLL
jgi:hypothetical protein